MKSGPIFHKDENGITYLNFKRGTITDLQDAKNDLEQTLLLNTDTPVLLLVNPNNVIRIEKEAQAFFKNVLKKEKKIKGVAIVINGYFTKYLLSFAFNFQRPIFPLKAFSNQKNAEEWLLSLK